MVSPIQAERRQRNDRRVEEAENFIGPADFAPRSGDEQKIPRRRQIDPTTCERDYSLEEVEFMRALDSYKRTHGRMFPTCSEILEVLRELGYVRVTA